MYVRITHTNIHGHIIYICRHLARRRRLSIDDDMDPLPYGAALPLEERFWDDVFAEAKRWGLYTYEQARNLSMFVLKQPITQNPT